MGNKLLNNIVTIASIGIGIYGGIQFFTPLVLIALIYFIATKPFKLNHGLVLPVAIQLGHITWIILGVFLLSHYTLGIMLDIIIVLSCSVCLLAKPNKIAAVILTLYNIFGLTMNFVSMINVEINSVESKALTVHIGIRLVTLILLTGYIFAKKVIKEKEA